jgi:hypothetical protein
VAVVAGEVRGRQIRRDAPGFFRRGLGVAENVSNKVDEIGNLYRDHFSRRSSWFGACRFVTPYALTLA